MHSYLWLYYLLFAPIRTTDPNSTILCPALHQVCITQAQIQEEMPLIQNSSSVQVPTSHSSPYASKPRSGNDFLILLVHVLLNSPFIKFFLTEIFE